MNIVGRASARAWPRHCYCYCMMSNESNIFFNLIMEERQSDRIDEMPPIANRFWRAIYQGRRIGELLHYTTSTLPFSISLTCWKLLSEGDNRAYILYFCTCFWLSNYWCEEITKGNHDSIQFCTHTHVMYNISAFDYPICMSYCTSYYQLLVLASFWKQLVLQNINFSSR